VDRTIPGDEDRLAPNRSLSHSAAGVSPDRQYREDRLRLAAVALLTLVPFVLLAVWARFLSPAPWEPDLMRTLAIQPGMPGDILRAMNTLGNLPVWAVVVGVGAAAIGAMRGIVAGLLTGLSFASDLAAFVVKILVERDRPETAAVEQFFGADNFSYPSGHTVRAAAFVTVAIFLLAPARWRLGLALGGGAVAGLVMGYARVGLGVHWPTDTLGGTLLGIGWFAVTTFLVLPRVQRNVP
jgi:membrane-associated phospholipid phosphatase